eukprot:gb/GEZJ01005097.1/.p1 GENE.gb/GEZJ01005097.1/~~gb/GEZJ01005097.1/.p1  ORF type:complete len:126 (-),score=21.65 gb/GEZJ01005097.1/:960-1337(-)
MNAVGSTPVCEPCNISKSCRDYRSRKTPEDEKKPGDLVCTDVVGPISVLSHGVAQDYFTLYDDASAFSMARLLARRSEVQAAVKKMIMELETAPDKKMKLVRMDNAKEYLSHELVDWMKQRSTTC